jgi:hypothetical protein
VDGRKEKACNEEQTSVWDLGKVAVLEDLQYTTNAEHSKEKKKYQIAHIMMARIVTRYDAPWIALYRVTWLLTAVIACLMPLVPQSTLEADFHLLWLCEVKNTLGGMARRGP